MDKQIECFTYQNTRTSYLQKTVTYCAIAIDLFAFVLLWSFVVSLCFCGRFCLVFGMFRKWRILNFIKVVKVFIVVASSIPFIVSLVKVGKKECS